jgi:cytoskeleton protein RodZ
MSAQNSHYAQVIEPNGNQSGSAPPGAAPPGNVPPGNVPPGAALGGAIPGGTARIGAELREVRERAGWKLVQVAEALRIREPYLDAIERGDLEALPGPAYQIGFVRSYAQVLGLDGDEILRRFRAEGVGAIKKPELSFLAPVPDRAVPSGAIVLLGVVVLLVGYGLWFLHPQNDRTLAASVAAVPAELAPLAVPEAPAPKAAAPAVATTAAKPAANQATASAGIGAAPAKTNAAAISTPGAVAVSAAPAAGVPAAGAPAAGVPATGVPAAGVPAGRSILATADSWVEVKDASGNILFSRVMHAGDSWPVPDLPGLTMTAGNAGGTEIGNNGAAGPKLGGAGTVLRNYALTPAAPGAASAPPAANPAATQ